MMLLQGAQGDRDGDSGVTGPWVSGPGHWVDIGVTKSFKLKAYVSKNYPRGPSTQKYTPWDFQSSVLYSWAYILFPFGCQLGTLKHRAERNSSKPLTLSLCAIPSDLLSCSRPVPYHKWAQWMSVLNLLLRVLPFSPTLQTVLAHPCSKLTTTSRPQPYSCNSG